MQRSPSFLDLQVPLAAEQAGLQQFLLAGGDGAPLELPAQPDVHARVALDTSQVGCWLTSLHFTQLYAVVRKQVRVTTGSWVTHGPWRMST